MTKILTVSEAITTFRQVETKLGLTLTENHQFFTEWMDELPPFSELEQGRLEQVRQNYLYQISDGILLEETVKMVVLSPLLELAAFYQAPYKFRAVQMKQVSPPGMKVVFPPLPIPHSLLPTFKSEVSVEIEALGDDDEILRGRIDALVLLEQLWIVLIESKKTTFDLELAIPQKLGCVVANPKPE